MPRRQVKSGVNTLFKKMYTVKNLNVSMTLSNKQLCFDFYIKSLNLP